MNEERLAQLERLDAALRSETLYLDAHIVERMNPFHRGPSNHAQARLEGARNLRQYLMEIK